MTRLLIALLVAAPLAAQQAPPPPAPTDKGLQTVTAALAKLPPKTPDGGGPPSTTVIALQKLNEARAACALVTKAERLYAACDNTTPAGAARLPKTLLEWQEFAKELQRADAIVNGQKRGVVVLNGATTMAEMTKAGLLVPRK